MEMSENLIVLAAGGTGGHVFPAEALASELIKRGFRLILITDRRGGALGNMETHRIRAGAIAGKKLTALLRNGPELAIGTLQSWSLLKKLQPRAVVGFGGYASVPTMLAATFGNYNSIIHEQNAVLGRANRLLVSRVKRVATSFKCTRLVPNSALNKVVYTGMPVRPDVAAVRKISYPELSNKGEIRLLVLGGSQGAHIFSEVIPEAISRLSADLKSRIFISQQCREEDMVGTREAYRRLAVNADLKSFFNDIPEQFARSHLLLSRAGASTVSEAMTVGRPAILVPYPFAVDDHQTFNSYALDEVGGGWLMSQESFTPDSLAERLNSLLAVPKLLNRAAGCAKSSGQPDAAVKLADAVCDLVGKEKNERRAA